jgi:hypothetical protein
LHILSTNSIVQNIGVEAPAAPRFPHDISRGEAPACHVARPTNSSSTPAAARPTTREALIELNAATFFNAESLRRPRRLASLVRIWIDKTALRFRVSLRSLIWRRCIKR